jgi:hypothetical protein
VVAAVEGGQKYALPMIFAEPFTPFWVDNLGSNTVVCHHMWLCGTWEFSTWFEILVHVWAGTKHRPDMLKVTMSSDVRSQILLELEAVLDA